MTTPFADLDAALSAAIDDAFAEAVTVSPFSKSDYAAAPDGSRPVATTEGIFSSGPIAERIGSEGRGGFDGPTKRSSQTATLWIAAAKIAALPYRIAKGDRISFPARAGQVFEVSSVDTTDLGDVEFNLNKVSA